MSMTFECVSLEELVFSLFSFYNITHFDWIVLLENKYWEKNALSWHFFNKCKDCHFQYFNEFYLKTN